MPGGAQTGVNVEPVAVELVAIRLLKVSSNEKFVFQNEVQV